MNYTERTFTVASDENLVGLIQRASQRLVVVAPAVSDAVAEALIGRLRDLGRVAVTVILDADPEVYRLGYGTETALDRLRSASSDNLFDLRVQPGVRIGSVISDEIILFFAPVPQLIEAGSTTRDKPNGIMLTGTAAGKVADATGLAANGVQEVGIQALTPKMVDTLKHDLKTNPPQKFDVARTLRIFSSKIQYVEFEVSNYRLSGRRVQLPDELVDIKSDELRRQISGQLRAPAASLGSVNICVETEAGKEQVEIDEKWLAKERKRIEDRYTIVVPRFGRVIFYMHRSDFDKEITCFKHVLAAYHQAVVAEVNKMKKSFEQRIIDEFLPRWVANPPAKVTHYVPNPTRSDLEEYIRAIAESLFQDTVEYEPPQVRIVYKSIAPESIDDAAFLPSLRQALKRKRIPPSVIDSLFTSGEAAPTPPLTR
jgi:hypothetical protein